MKEPKKISRQDFLKGFTTSTVGVAPLDVLAGCESTGTSASLNSPVSNTEGNPYRDIYILYTNDVHCAMDANIGYAGLMEIKAALLSTGNDVLLVDSGDYIQGGPAGLLSEGKYLIDLMNAVAYDVATIGNHEFDFGMDTFYERMCETNFPVVCCNFFDKDGNALLNPYIILEAGGRKVGFVGVVTPTTINSVTPAYFQDGNGNFIYDFCYDSTGDKLVATMQSAIDGAKKDGADTIIVLGHIGINQTKLNSHEIISKISGVDLFLDGHSHTILPSESVRDKDGKNVILTQAGTQLNYVGLAIIKADGTVSSQLLDDIGVKTLISEIQADIDEDLKKAVGKSEFSLWIYDPDDTAKRLARSQETNLGDFCADAFRFTGKAEIGIINGGAIRTNLSAGEITYGNLLDVFPFNNFICVRKVNGSELLDALELSVSQEPDEFGGFLQVSGLSFTLDTSIPSSVKLDENGMFASCNGERRIRDVYVNGEPLDENRGYTVASVTYLLRDSGNGYSMFQGELIQENGATDVQALVTYLQDGLNGEISDDYENPYGAGRIIEI